MSSYRKIGERVKIGDVCPHCKEGKLELVYEVEPWNPEFLICPECDSTYMPDYEEKED